jgi:sugar phosphate isomerase/epimerase
MSVHYPDIHLAIDNVFASKRWTGPEEWMRIIKSFGVSCVEASADNECDPLYMEEGYLADWVGEVKRQASGQGMKVVSIFSGHGTYTTLGLAHHDKRVRDRIQFDWLYRMIDMAAALQAGTGFYCHAFSQLVLQDVSLYRQRLDDLYQRLSELADYARQRKVDTVGIEQMYSPHQVPWTIRGSKELLKAIYRVSGSPLYIVIDTGHQCGQSTYLKPGTGQLSDYLDNVRQHRGTDVIWLGPEVNSELLAACQEGERTGLQEILANIENHPHLFAESLDADPYAWLAALGCYSPVIHLQQTDGCHSSHWPFTGDRNENGIIRGDLLLNAIARSYASEAEAGMPPRCKTIYLTLEIFSPTSERPDKLLQQMEDSVKYWRAFVPEDGLSLGELI